MQAARVKEFPIVRMGLQGGVIDLEGLRLPIHLGQELGLHHKEHDGILATLVAHQPQPLAGLVQVAALGLEARQADAGVLGMLPPDLEVPGRRRLGLAVEFLHPSQIVGGIVPALLGLPQPGEIVAPGGQILELQGEDAQGEEHIGLPGRFHQHAGKDLPGAVQLLVIHQELGVEGLQPLVAGILGDEALQGGPGLRLAVRVLEQLDQKQPGLDPVWPQLGGALGGGHRLVRALGTRRHQGAGEPGVGVVRLARGQLLHELHALPRWPQLVDQAGQLDKTALPLVRGQVDQPPQMIHGTLQVLVLQAHEGGDLMSGEGIGGNLQPEGHRAPHGLVLVRGQGRARGLFRQVLVPRQLGRPGQVLEGRQVLATLRGDLAGQDGIDERLGQARRGLDGRRRRRCSGLGSWGGLPGLEAVG